MSHTYETDKLVREYIHFHFGKPSDLMPYEYGPLFAVDFPKRCGEVSLELLRKEGRPLQTLRALDLGCAVGRSSFEMAREVGEVVGIDYSHRFVETCNALKAEGRASYSVTTEGGLVSDHRVDLDQMGLTGEVRKRCGFEQGDACGLEVGRLGRFDLVLAANLIDRLHTPRACLSLLPHLVKEGGLLVVTSPYTWLEEFTPKDNWLGGYKRKVERKEGGGGEEKEKEEEEEVTTLQGLSEALHPSFALVSKSDMPFLIYETRRKFQFTVAQCTVWRRTSTN